MFRSTLSFQTLWDAILEFFEQLLQEMQAKVEENPLMVFVYFVLLLIVLRLLAVILRYLSRFFTSKSSITKRLRRLYGYRKLYALLLAPFIVLIVAVLARLIAFEIVWDFEPGSQSVIDLVALALLWLGSAYWLLLLTQPLRQTKPFQSIPESVTTGVRVLSVLPPVVMIGIGIVQAGRVEATLISHTLASIALISLVPLTCGAIVIKWPDIREYLRENRAFDRHFQRDADPREQFAGPKTLRKHIQPLKHDSNNKAGITTDSVYVGRTLFDHNYYRNHVFLNETAHSYTIASTGAGKLLKIAGRAATYTGSAIMISPKPELADMFASRRQDIRLLEKSQTGKYRNNGVDVRGITKCRYHLPNSRSFILDPAGESVYPSHSHPILSEVDIKDVNAAAMIKALAQSFIPINPHVPDPFWGDSSRSFLASGIAFGLINSKDPSKKTLPAVVDLMLGIDEHGRADPDRFNKTLIKMAACNAFGGMIQSGASKMLQAGEKTRGSILVQLHNALAWILDPVMRMHLSRPADFSYREVGVDGEPVSVFIIPRPIAPDEANPFLRVHAELALSILKTKRVRPSIPTWICCDEYRAWGQGVNEIQKGMTYLRDSRALLDLYIQSWDSLVETVGEAAANEIEASGTGTFFGIDDINTAERITRILGSRMDHNKWYQSEAYRCPVMSPQQILRDLRKTSNLQIVMPSTAPPMMLERLAHKPLRTKDGARFNGLPLAGHYDELSRYQYGTRGK